MINLHTYASHWSWDQRNTPQRLHTRTHTCTHARTHEHTHIRTHTRAHLLTFVFLRRRQADSPADCEAAEGEAGWHFTTLQLALAVPHNSQLQRRRGPGCRPHEKRDGPRSPGSCCVSSQQPLASYSLRQFWEVTLHAFLWWLITFS